MNDSRAELLKALREHGQTLRKMADGGDVTALSGPRASGQGSSTQAGGIGGFLGDLLGTQNKFSASGAPIQAGTNASQLNHAYTGAQEGIQSQQQLLNALQGQNGIQNQSDVYNQFQNVAAGQGPNPAQAMLNQATGQNVANQAALMASQRGTGANPGLIARQAAQQGAQVQQNAIGQAASMQAQQQLNALNNLQGIAQNQVGNLSNATAGYNQAQQNEQQILQQANAALNNANVGMQSNINDANAQVSMGNQRANSGLVGGILGGAASALGSLFADGGEVKGEWANGLGPDPEKARQVREGLFDKKHSFGEAWGNLKAEYGRIKGAISGETPKKYAEGGTAPFNIQAPMLAPAAPMQAEGPASSLGQYMAAQNAPQSIYQGSRLKADESDMFGSGFAKGMDELGTKVGQWATKKEEAGQAAGGAGSRFATPFEGGGEVPGKPVVGGTVDTEKNDTVPALLSAGEVVLPRSVTKSKDPASAAAKFVEALMKKKNKEKAA